jgi:deoxyribodipyrimidine photo-lyase
MRSGISSECTVGPYFRTMPSTAVVWLRSDLRVHDHPALRAAVDANERVLPLFVRDERLLHRSGPRAAFLLESLRELDGELRGRGGGLCVRTGPPEEVVAAVAREAGACAVHRTSDVSPFARRRDAEVSKALRAGGVQPRPHGGGYCADVSLPRTRAGRPLTVFTPFWRAWQRLERRPVLNAPARMRLPEGVEHERAGLGRERREHGIVHRPIGGELDQRKVVDPRPGVEEAPRRTSAGAIRWHGCR